MTLKEWQSLLGSKYKKQPGMHGIYDSYDMEDRVVIREVYIKGWLVMTLAPIWPDSDETDEE